MSIDHGGQIDANGSAYSIANHQCTPVISRQTSLLQPDLKGHRTTRLTERSSWFEHKVVFQASR